MDDASLLAARLNSAAIHFLRRLRRRDEESGLSAARLSALSVIVFAGPLTMSRLARAEGVRLPTISRLVASLEHDGLVRRTADASDRRTVLVQVTERGAELLEAARQRRVADLSERLRCLSPADLATLERAATLLEELSRQ